MTLKSWSWEEKYPFAGASKHGVTSSWKHQRNESEILVYENRTYIQRCKQTWCHIKLEALYDIHVQGSINKSQTEHEQNFYKNNAEASRIEQILKTRDLTSSKLCKLSQTLVPLISDICRSEVSPPKITKTFCLDVPLWIASACFDDCNFLDKAVHALLHGTREGNREQACWITVRRIREWENPTWKCEKVCFWFWS